MIMDNQGGTFCRFSFLCKGKKIERKELLIFLNRSQVKFAIDYSQMHKIIFVIAIV